MPSLPPPWPGPDSAPAAAPFRLPEAVPYATPQWPGCGGRFKTLPDDFAVDEIALYAPSGEGEHLYARLWKRGMTTQQALQRISEATGVPLRAIGWAGRKDAQAVTTQWISLHAPEAPLHQAESADLRFLELSRHGNKLRRGHLLGNRFRVRVRGATLLPHWEELVEFCARQGFPNLFGPQRFGAAGRNAENGRRLLTRLRGARRVNDAQRFLLHAYQAALFNSLLARRLTELGSLGRLLPGDLAVLHRNGAAFPAAPEALTDLQARADARELSPSAPLFGWRVPLAEGHPGRWEREALAAANLTLDAFRFGTKDASLPGERRAVRAFPAGLSWTPSFDGGEPALELHFTLAPGVYATSLLRELMKTPELDQAPPLDTED